MTPPVSTGLDALLAEPGALHARRVGLATNATGTTRDLRRNVDALLAAGVPVVTLFGPEHGLHGTAQAGATEAAGADETTGLPVYETYAADAGRLDGTLAAADVDCLLFDMQDVGIRYFTYVWTMFDLMHSAARLGMAFAVLDRPNPIGSRVQGPPVAEGFESFIGRMDVPMRHGLTAGELARLMQASDPELAGLRLRVFRCEGWQRDRTFAQSALAWVPPSPNLPTVTSVHAFAATALFEGTNVSEGRGTTTPFEVVGAPFFDRRLVENLRALALPGVLARETRFTPSFHKYSGQQLRGFQLHITDPARFDPLATALALLGTVNDLYDDFAFLTTEGGRRHFDLLWGADDLRQALEGRRSLERFYAPARRPSETYPAGVLLY